MAVYTPPQGDDVKFQLTVYSPPDGLSVNFELLEALGTQIVAWENIAVSEDVSLERKDTFKVIDVFEDIALSEYLIAYPDLWFISEGEPSVVIEENFNIYVDPLGVIVDDSISTDEATYSYPPVLVPDVYTEVLVSEWIDHNLVWIIEILYEQLIVIEDVIVVDLVIENWLVVDEVQVQEYFETWTDWHNEWSSFDDIYALERLIIGKDVIEPADFVQEITVSDFAGIAPWALFGESDSQVTVQDVVDRILVGYFPLPLEYVSIEEVIVNIEVFPPYPAPIQYLSIGESVGFTMDPPSLSWISEYPHIVEYLVVGQDPHFADLGYQGIQIQEVPTLSPNPLYIDAQDLGEETPVIHEFVRASVGFPIYVADWMTATDELVGLILETLVPAVSDEVHVEESFEFWYPTLGVQAQEVIGVQDVIEIAPDTLYVEVLTNTNLSELVVGWTGQEINVFESLSNVEEYAFVLDLVIELPGPMQEVMVEEYAFASFDAWIINVFDDVSCADTLDSWVGQEISVYSDIFVEEFFDGAFRNVLVSVYESIAAEETLWVYFPPEVSVYDWIEAEEFSSLVDSAIYAVVFDGIEINEYIFLKQVLPINVFDTAYLSDAWVLLGLDPIFAEVQEAIGISEFINASIPGLEISAYEGMSVSDNFNGVVDNHIYAQWFQDIGVEEYLPTLRVTTSVFGMSMVGVVEETALYPDPLSQYVSDLITIDEFLSTLWLWNLSVYEDFYIDEITNYAAGVYLLFETENVWIEEYLSLHTTGLAVYPHVNIFKEEVVNVSVDPLNISLEDVIFVTEFHDSGNVVGDEWVEIEENVGLYLSALFLDVREDLGVEEYQYGYVIAPNEMPLHAIDEVVIAEVAGSYLNQLWTGIQTDFINIDDELDRILCGFLIDVAENLEISDWVEFDIGTLYFSVLDSVGTFDRAGGWYAFPEVIQGFEPFDVEEYASILIPTLFIDISQDVAVQEWVDRKGGINSNPLEILVAVDEYIELFLPWLAIVPFDEVHVSESVAFRGLTIRIEVVDNIAVSEWSRKYWDPVLFAYDSVNVDEPYCVLQTVSAWPQINVFQDITIGPYREVVYLSVYPPGPPVLFAIQYIYAAEWTAQDSLLDPNLIDVVQEIIVSSEFASGDLPIDFSVADLIGYSETPAFILWPPVVQVFDHIGVSDWTSFYYLPWAINVFDTIVSVIDIGWSYIRFAANPNVYTSIIVEEFVQVHRAGDAWYLGVAENFIITEWFYPGITPMPLETSDDISIFDVAILTDLMIELGIVVEQILTSENIWNSLSIGADVYDQVTVTGDLTQITVGLGLTATDTLALLEFRIVNLPVDLSRYDVISAAEYRNLIVSINASVLDAIQIDEFAKAVLPRLYTSVYESLSIEDYADFMSAIWVSVYNSVSLVDDSVVSIDSLHLLALQNIVILESSVWAWHPELMIIQVLAVAESPVVWLDKINTLILDDITVYEDARALLPRLFASVFDGLSIADAAISFLPSLSVYKAESVAIAEWAARVSGFWAFSVYQTVAIAEYQALLRDAWNLSVFQTLSIAESRVLFMGIGVEVAGEIFTGEFAAGLLDRLIVNGVDFLTVEEAIWESLLHRISLSDQVFVSEYKEIYYPLDLFRFQSITASELSMNDVQILLATFDNAIIEDEGFLSLNRLYISVNSLALLNEFCLTILDYKLVIYDAIQVGEAFVWGLPVQFIDAYDGITVGEDKGVYREPYELYPIIFDASERGYF